MLKALRARGLDKEGEPVILQSMELTNLQVIVRGGLTVPLVFLTKRKGNPYDLGRPTRLVADAHAAGLEVMPYTFCAQNECLPADYRRGEGDASVGDATGELLAFLRAGVDGVFADEPDLAVTARTALVGAG